MTELEPYVRAYDDGFRKAMDMTYDILKRVLDNIDAGDVPMPTQPLRDFLAAWDRNRARKRPDNVLDVFPDEI